MVDSFFSRFIHVDISHTPSTITATPCLQILLTILLQFTVCLTFLPAFEPLFLMYRPITIPYLSPLSHRELVTYPTKSTNVHTNNCYCVPHFSRIKFVVICIITCGQMQKIPSDVVYLIVIFALNIKKKDHDRPFLIY